MAPTLALRVLIASLLATVTLGALAVVQAATSYEPGTTGWDVSWPQCDSKLPRGGGSFAVIGVNNGIAFSENPCFEAQLAWANDLAQGASLYVNLANPGPLGSNWPCDAAVPATDTDCAYQYGRLAAESTLAFLSSLGLTAGNYFWWLDVEIANSWEGDAIANEAAIRGYLERLGQAQVSAIGIYSTAYQWGLIAGDFAPGLPVWQAGARSEKTAGQYCDPGFAGGEVLLVQYFSKGFDGDLVCGGEPSTGGGGGRPDNPGPKPR